MHFFERGTIVVKSQKYTFPLPESKRYLHKKTGYQCSVFWLCRRRKKFQQRNETCRSFQIQIHTGKVLPKNFWCIVLQRVLGDMKDCHQVCYKMYLNQSSEQMSRVCRWVGPKCSQKPINQKSHVGAAYEKIVMSSPNRTKISKAANWTQTEPVKDLKMIGSNYFANQLTGKLFSNNESLIPVVRENEIMIILGKVEYPFRNWSEKVLTNVRNPSESFGPFQTFSVITSICPIN